MPAAITRRRTGCVVCRKRRVRCDEAKPSCQNCIRNSQTCTWLKDIRFVNENDNAGSKRRRSSAASKVPDAAAQDDIERGGSESSATFGATRNYSAPLSGTVASQDAAVLWSNGDSNHFGLNGTTASELTPFQSSVMPNHSYHTTTALTSNYVDNADGEVTEICHSESVRLARSIEREHELPIPPNLNPNPEGFTDWKVLGVTEELRVALNSDLEVKLLNNYIWECAPWFDAHNSKLHFSKTDINRMMNCPPWRAAALALSAKNLELRKGNATNAESLSLHLYQLAVRLAIDSISGRFDCVGTLSGCVLLTVYEMMTVSYTEWRRHLQGCASIYVHNNWNGSSGGLISASFWEYAQIDIWAAFCSATDTLIDTDFWFSEPSTIMSLSALTEDVHAQVATWLLGRTVNLIHQDTRPRPAALEAEYQSIREDLSNWKSMGSAACQPVITRDASSDEVPFPRILFSSHSSIISHTMYHTAMVLLLEYEQAESPPRNEEASEALYEHSRTACGIIETNDQTACLVNSLQPIWICGRYLRTKAEKSAALEMLTQIEKKSGWKCEWRSNGLREFWKMSNGEV